MSHRPEKLVKYKHQDLMNELNELFITVKIHLLIDNKKARSQHPIPSSENLDKLLSKVFEILKQDNEPFIKH